MNSQTEDRILIIVQNLPVPFDRRVWLECQTLRDAGYQVAVICPKGPGDPGYAVLDGVELYKYRPYASKGGVASFVLEYVYSFVATLWLALKAETRPRLRRRPELQPTRYLLADRPALPPPVWIPLCLRPP